MSARKILIVYRFKPIAADASEAMRWFHMAAEHGYALAQFTLGLEYGDGVAVEQDLVEAYAWLMVARSQGAPVSDVDIQAIVDGMTEEQKLEAAYLGAA